MHTQHQCPAVPRALQRLPLTAHPTGSPRESSGTPSSPWPQPWPGWSATTSRSLRFQTHSARVCLLRPNRSLGLGVPWAWEWSYQRERPSPGPARKAQPRVGSGSWAAAPPQWTELQGSSASSPRRHLLPERVLDPRAVVGVGTAIGSNSTPSHRIPLHFQPPTDGAQQGWGWVYAIFLAPACPAACGF